MDIDSLLARLRATAAEHAPAEPAEGVAARPWPGGEPAGLRQALLDGLAAGSVADFGRFLGIDAGDFVDLAFFSTLGRAADPAGRAHYLGLVQGGTPRLEILSDLTGSAEGLACRGPVAWPLGLRPLLWGLGLPSAFGRRVARGLLRRVERLLARGSSKAAERALWKLAAAADERDHALQREIAGLERGFTAAGERAAALEARAETAEGRAGAIEAAMTTGFEASSAALVALRARLAVIEYEGARAKDGAAVVGKMPGASGETLGPVVADASARPLGSVSTVARVGASEAHGSTAEAAAAIGIASSRAEGKSLSGGDSIGAGATDDDVTRYYLTLESVFRGDPERIRAQLQADYLQLLLDARARAGDGLCVDLGCGRGEWLDVLGAHGFAATGVDANPFMANAARERGVAAAAGADFGVVGGESLASKTGEPKRDVAVVEPRSGMVEAPGRSAPGVAVASGSGAAGVEAAAPERGAADMAVASERNVAGLEPRASMAAEPERAPRVVQGDALAYLCSLPDDSVLAVTAFHLVEHLPFAVLFRLIAECRRVLKPEGILILETPNPENIWVATHTFHHDPTHGNPLTPASLEFLVNHHGLQTVDVLRLHPYPPEARLPGTDLASERLNGMTCCGQDFAVVAKKVAA